MEYTIVNSGSDGNCVVIERMMIDIGLSYKKISKYLHNIDIIFITHQHGDHVKKSTLKQIRKYHPKIKIMCSKQLKQFLKDDDLITLKSGVQYNVKLKDTTITIEPFDCVHNVVTQGIVFKYNGEYGIYATDTNSLENSYKCNLGNGVYDYFFIEANYDKYKLRAIDNDKYGYDVIKGARRHLSKQDSYNFYLLNRRNVDSKYIQLHKSSRFY
ncbi:MBL fold metallo-hydrolase [Gemella sanguinis]|uniref:MBL fold metallo-hydrolase n=1 Tax=Gemella sanguinis TaxID=84135 RepID=UPI00352C8B12